MPGASQAKGLSPTDYLRLYQPTEDYTDFKVKARMPTPFDRQPHDLAVKSIAPLSPLDPRVPMAEEFALDAEIGVHLFKSGRVSTWAGAPAFFISGPRLIISCSAKLAISTDPVALDLALLPTPLANSIDIVDRIDKFFLVGFAAEIGESQDPLLGTVNFSYQTPDSLQGVQKENARRLRSFWVVVATIRDLSKADILNVLGPTAILTIANVSDAGFALGTYQIYAKDPRLVVNKTYSILPDSIDILPITGVIRRQNFVESGFTYGLGGEVLDELSPLKLALPEQISAQETFPELLSKRFIEICAGRSCRLKGFKRGVYNLSIGSNPNNPGRAGIATPSPNGSVAVANDQRISFSNQAISESIGAYPVTVTNNGGAALVSVGLNTSAPSGSYFDADPKAHKIYKSDGSEQSDLGSFTNLGGVGSLQWIGTANTTLTPGEIAYVVPSIRYPAGSGLEVTFEAILNVWHEGVAIDRDNILVGWENDLIEYANPVGGDIWRVVVGAERSAIHYIYKKITVTVGADGVARLPIGETGCFAFIEGVSGRLDRPVVRDAPQGVINALIYHAPRSTQSWQFELLYADYQGLGSSWNSFVAGATVVSKPRVFAHAQGGGNSVFRGDRQLRYVPVAGHLPQAFGGIRSYSLDTPIHLDGENYQGPNTFREIEVIAGADCIVPLPSDILETESTLLVNPRSVNFSITIDEEPIGFLAPKLSGARPYQLVVTFAIANNGTTKILVATKNVAGGESVVLDPAQGTAIDLFELS
jgi:hypothetical protein